MLVAGKLLQHAEKCEWPLRQFSCSISQMSTDESHIIRVVTLGFDGALASSITGPADLFFVANTVRTGADPQKQKALPRYVWELAAAAPFMASSGVKFVPTTDLEAVRHADIVIVPGIAIYDEVERRKVLIEINDSINLLSTSLKPAATIVGLCTGGLILAEAGLLSQRSATTSWWNTRNAQKDYPNVRFVTDQLVVRDGPFMTAGAGAAYFDAVLSQIEMDAGHAHANTVAKYFVLNRDKGAQQDFVLPLHATSRDPRLARADSWARKPENAYKSVKDMAVYLGMSSRSVQRYFHEVIQKSPREFLRSTRLGIAHQMLKSSHNSIDDIAETVGYSDPNAFRRAYRSHFGVTATATRMTGRLAM